MYAVFETFTSLIFYMLVYWIYVLVEYLCHNDTHCYMKWLSFIFPYRRLLFTICILVLTYLIDVFLCLIFKLSFHFGINIQSSWISNALQFVHFKQSYNYVYNGTWQDAHGPHHYPEKQFQSNKHICKKLW